MTIVDITDPKCMECPINAKCMTCEYMMQEAKERRKKYEDEIRRRNKDG